MKFVNTNGLLNFNVDLKKCEEFAASRPVRGFAVGTLEMSFEELRQVCLRIVFLGSSLNLI